jgi:hypothetical protein
MLNLFHSPVRMGQSSRPRRWLARGHERGPVCLATCSDAPGAATDGAYPVGAVVVAVAVDGEPAGLLILADRLRSEAARVINSLRHLGITRIVMASGDRRNAVAAVPSRSVCPTG